MPVEFNGGGQIPAPQAPQMGPAQESRLPHGVRPPFVLAHHPVRWMFVDGEWLPDLVPITIEPGISAVDKAGDTTLMLVESQKRGRIVLPWELVPPSTPSGKYIRAYPCTGPRGALYHCTIWEEPRVLAGRPAPDRVDQDGYRAWLRWLIAERHIPAMQEEARLLHLGNQEARVARATAKAELQPTLSHLQERQEAEKKSLEAMKAASEAPKGKGREARS